MIGDVQNYMSLIFNYTTEYAVETNIKIFKLLNIEIQNMINIY